VAHFLEWVDFSGNGVQPPVTPFTDPVSGLSFPNFDATVDPSLQTNLIFPVCCELVSASLPRCAVIRFTNSKGHGSSEFPDPHGPFHRPIPGIPSNPKKSGRSCRRGTTRPLGRMWVARKDHWGSGHFHAARQNGRCVPTSITAPEFQPTASHDLTRKVLPVSIGFENAEAYCRLLRGFWLLPTGVARCGEMQIVDLDRALL